MRYLQIFLVLVMVLSLALLAALAPISFADESKLTTDEAALFKRISKVYPEFHYSDKVLRHYRFYFETWTKVPFLVEHVFPRDGLLFDRYISYSVTFEPYTSIVSYSFDAGTAHRGEGSIFVTPLAVIKIERGCGVTACITQILRNGKPLLEEKG